MDLLTIIATAVGLSMDAFAVSISIGIKLPRAKVTDSLKVALCFGLFQAIMPLIGFWCGSYFRNFIVNYDHWVAFILLSLIGGKMIWESTKQDNEDSHDYSKFSSILILGIATSIDALVVGVNFAFVKADIVLSVLYIGIITFMISLIGVYFGKKFGDMFSKKAEVAGGIILIAIGARILIQHLFF